MNAPDEPLEISAPLAWQFAKDHCNRDPTTGESCAWNHGLWQFLRIIGLAGTAAHRGELYQSEVKACAAQNPAPRILICGTTDYAMLAQVIAAFSDTNTKPSVTVIDVCETPLRLNLWYAKRATFRIQTARTSIFDYKSAGGYDLICTDSFLGRFPYAQWPQLVSQWHSLLKLGGRIVTASRLRTGAAAKREGFSVDQANNFRNEVIRRADQHAASLPVPLNELEQAAIVYSERHFTYPVHSATEIGSLFEQADFALEKLAVIKNTVDSRSGLNAPSVPSGKNFLTVVARRQ